jgi:hypothetical protein
MTPNTDDPLSKRLAEDEATLAALKTQRTTLDQQIADWEELVRITRDIIAKRPNAASPVSPAPEPIEEPEPPKLVRHRPGSKTYRVYEAVGRLLSGGRTMHRKVLYERLLKDGVFDEQTTLLHFSHLMSMAKGRFVSDGAGNWSADTGGSP